MLKSLIFGAALIVAAVSVPVAKAAETDPTEWKYTIKDENNQDTCFNTCNPDDLPAGTRCPCQVLPDIIVNP